VIGGIERRGAVPGLGLLHSCRHEGPPEESRPCTEQAEDMQLTATRSEMTMEEHVASAETHLRYAEGHLQPSDEHLADEEVHLKLVRAHLAALEPAEQEETRPAEAMPPPTQKVPTVEAEAVPPPVRKVPTKEAKVVPPPQEARKWTCPVGECQEAVAHPLSECKEFGELSVTKRR